MRLPQQMFDAIVAHARWAFPNEACGLVAADTRGRLRMAYCLSNLSHDASRFTVDPAEHFGAMRHAERCGWRIAGSFHSHPLSEAMPSPSDIAGALDPDWIYLIAGPVDRTVAVRGFEIREGRADEVELTVVG